MKGNVDLNALRTFRLVVDAGGFTAAAHRSHRAVSSISRQIQTLERSLGQALFHRHTRAVELTEAGKHYIEAIRPVLADLDAATENITAAKDEPAGTLTINAPVAFGERQVVPLIRGFSRRYPKITTELRLTDQFVDPVRSAADVTFRVGPLTDSNLVARTLAPMRYIVAASPDYLATAGTPTSPAALLDHDCLRYQGEYGRQRWFWRQPDAADFQRLDVDGSLHSDDAPSLRHAAVLGQGIVLFPSWMIAKELDEGSLVALLNEWQWEVAPEERSIHLLYAASRLGPRKVALFVDYITEQVGDPPLWDRRPLSQDP
ncbi:MULTISPECIES: LysR family transcriptional regulator [unclassified Halomonas]|uniref:LysR family transcriptional regulator n=1 Tax=unclassified Halomonas TaxID=2609666 RepID=UPI001C94FBB4|nr:MULTISPECIES: LysR family transcriptional regulator [unclassified Halomonas]MBY5927335.1 LysR family transcriptional regulator [Halomonas sp. DP4Y7-2]MBY6234376.1 LysR family transcriptional regulator [Halomonas sp. DP4Y7-1]